MKTLYTRDLDRARELIDRREVLVGVVGLGNVGAVVSAAFLYRGFRVAGFDIDYERIRSGLERGSHEIHVESTVREILFSAYREGRLYVSDLDRGPVDDVDVFIVTVPVYWDRDRVDTGALVDVSEKIGRRMKRGSVVVIESSVPPGTTRRIAREVLERVSGMSAGVDFGVAYSPERVSIGRAFEDLVKRYPKIVSGIDSYSLEIVSYLYGSVVERGVLRASSLETAEFTKLIEGVYRDVNIALANSLAEIASRLGVDFWEARELANTQPFSHIHAPGTGVGGVCIPSYPWFLIYSLPGLRDCWCTELLRVSREINDTQPERVSEALVEGLEKIGLGGHRDIKICVLGLSYRGDIPDTRGSPTYRVIEYLLSRGFREIYVHDPYASAGQGLERQYVFTRDLAECLRGSVAVLVSTDHSVYKEISLEDLARATGSERLVVVDGRRVLRKTGGVDGIECLYKTVGRDWDRC